MRRIGLFGLIVAVSPWLLLAVLAGNEGLQRSISTGAWTLITERPQAGLAVIGATLALSILAAPLLRGRSPLVARSRSSAGTSSRASSSPRSRSASWSRSTLPW